MTHDPFGNGFDEINVMSPLTLMTSLEKNDEN